MASNFRFGSLSSAYRTVSAERAEVAAQYDTKRNCDPDKLLQCPFDKNHQIRASRFPYHLIKCRKNHPQLVSQLKTCPFNARHLVSVHELAHHTETCEDRVSLDPAADESASGFRKWQVPASTWEMPEPSEDWEKEVEEDAEPFIWGKSTVLNEKPDQRLNCHLGPNFRIPNTLPWSDFKP